MTRIKQEYFESTDYFVLFSKTKNKAETQKSNFSYKIFIQHYVPFIQVTVFHFELNNS